MRLFAAVLGLLLALTANPVAAQNAREILTSAAFTPSDKPTALASIERAVQAADAVLARNPTDREARLQKALAISYRGKLTRGRGDLATARRTFEAAVAADPNNADAQMALAGWHLGAVIEVGPLLARTMLGARKATGLHAMDRAVALGGNRAFYPALASLHRIQLDPNDVASAQRLAEAAIKAGAPTALDRILQKQASTLLASLRKGNGKASAKLAAQLMPFGRLR